MHTRLHMMLGGGSVEVFRIRESGAKSAEHPNRC